MLTIVALLSAASAPFEPVGTWQVQSEDTYCSLSHDFVSADQKLSLAFRPSFGGDTIDLIVVSPGLRRKADGTARLLFAGETTKAPYAMAPDAAGSATIARIAPEKDVVEKLFDGGLLKIDAGEQSWSLRLRVGGKARGALTSCQQGLWAADTSPANLPAKLAKASISDLQRLFGNPDNYPDAAVKAGISGSVVSILTISAAGRVEQCKGVSAPHPLL